MDRESITPGCGVFYIAFGDQYRDEVIKSIQSLRRANPELPVAVVTDKPLDDASDVLTFIIRERILSLECKPVYMPESPFERTLYLDTDTFVSRNLLPAFLLLDRYDFACCYGTRAVTGLD